MIIQLKKMNIKVEMKNNCLYLTNNVLLLKVANMKYN